MISILLLFFITDLFSDDAYNEKYNLASLNDQQKIYLDKNNCWFDSLNVRFVGNWPFGNPYAVASDTARNLIFFGCGGGVYIYDMSNPASPMKLSEKIHTRSRFAYDLFYDMATQRLYTAGGWNTKNEIWDVSNPYDPIKLGGWDTQYFSWEVVVAGSYAYVADGEAGLRIINISDPTNPYEVSNCNVIGYTDHIAVSDSYAYVIGDSLFIFNVSNPTNPYIVGHYNADGWIYVKDTLAYMTGPQFRILNVSDPSYPYEIGHYEIPCSFVSVTDSFAYIIYNYFDIDSLYVLNITDPTNPYIVGRCDKTVGQVYGIDMLNSHLYISDSYHKLHVIDITDPGNPYYDNFLPTPYVARGVVISDSYAYIANDESGLRIINISDPTNPYEMGYYDTPGHAWWVTVLDSLAYVADFDSCLRIINISNPFNPVEVGKYYTLTYDVVYSAYHVPYVYLISCRSGLRIINVTDPINPFEVGYYDTPGNAMWVSFHDNLAYITGFINTVTSFLYILDISNPYNPTEIGNCAIQGCSGGIEVNGDYAYIVTAQDGLRIINISEPANPYEIGYFFVPGCCLNGVEIAGSFVHVADYSNMFLRTINVSNPTNPLEAGYYETPDSPFGVSLFDGRIWISDCFSGLQIYECYVNNVGDVIDKPISQYVKLLRNPINNGCIDLEIQLTETCDLDFYIYNTLGQEVKRYPEASYQSGSFRIKLSVENFASGVYFLKLRTRNDEIIQKILLINQ